MRDFVLIYINGKTHRIYGEDVFQPLSTFLRLNLRLIGTKVVCAEGDCGACTVLMGKKKGKTLRYVPINSCIKFIYQLDCSHIITVEGLKEEGNLHPVQQSMIDHFGSQCGYCTPGFVMAMAGMFEEKPARLKSRDVREALTGNLCRCTGYEPIIKATLAVNPNHVKTMGERFPSDAFLKDFQKHSQNSIAIHYSEKGFDHSQDRLYFNPATWQEALQLKKEHPTATVISGGTDISVQINKGRLFPQKVISLSNLTALNHIEVKDNVLWIGAKTTWTQLEQFTLKTLPEFHKIINVFASPQIKHVGTLAGNIANGSPIADSLPFLFVADAEIELAETSGTRWVYINRFYHGYKQCDMKPQELISRIRIPVPQPGQLLKLYKVSKRKDLDISTFTAGFMLEIEKSRIKTIKVSYGGVAPIVLRLPKTEEFLKGKKAELAVFQQAGKIARNEVTPISDVRASEEYRLQLSENVLVKLYHEIVAKSL